MFKITKERLILYELIEVMYTDCLTSFSALKMENLAANFHSLETKGIKLFDKGQMQYVLTLYECCNKINLLNRQINDIKMPAKTKNYLIDDLYEPYVNRFRQYIGNLREEEVLNILLRVEGASKVQQNWKLRVKAFEDAILKENSADSRAYIEKIKTRGQ